ncbi:MAG: fimbria/pilus outer membrane usher protein [Thermodesulfobacteriota bacterium]
MTAWMSARICARLKILFFLLAFLASSKEAFSEEFLILKAFLNEEAMGDVFAVRIDSDLWLKKEDFEKTRLKKVTPFPKGGLGGIKTAWKEKSFEGESYVSLSSVEGLDFKIDEREAALKIHVLPSLFESTSLNLSYQRPYSVVYPSYNSAFLNYGAYYDKDNSVFNLSAELGARLGDYFAVSTFNHLKTEDDEKTVRLLTSVRTDDRANLTTSVAGDFTTAGGPLGGGLTLGGFSFTKNYSIDPYLLRFPSLTLSGAVETPSEVEVYVNEMLVRREKLLPGEFTFTDVPATVGLGDAKIVIKDIYGRKFEVESPFYYSDGLLKKGLHEYSYGAGFIREDLGDKNFSYGDPVFMSLHNYGFSDDLKAGYALELKDGLFNAGSSATVLAPVVGGALDAAFSISKSEGESGYGARLGYVFRSRRVTAALSLSGFSGDFSNVSLKPSSDKAEFQWSAGIGYGGGKKIGSVSLEFSGSKMHSGEETFRQAAAYNRSITRSVAFFARLSSTETDGDTSQEIFAGIHAYLGKEFSASANYSRLEDDTIKKAGVQRNLPLGTGIGFRAEEEAHDEYTNRTADVRYQNDYGIYEADWFDMDGDSNYTLQASGGIGYIDSTAFLSRPINDSFAKVKTGGLPGVRVSYFGNEVGKTDSSGEAIVPVVRSFADNRLGIEKDDIPIDYGIPALSLYINPPYRSGSIVSFDIKKEQGFYGRVFVETEGRRKAVEYTILRLFAGDKKPALSKAEGIDGLVGKDGEFYFENVSPGEYGAKVFFNKKECDFNVTIPESAEVMVNIGEIVCMMPEELTEVIVEEFFVAPVVAEEFPAAAAPETPAPVAEVLKEEAPSAPLVPEAVEVPLAEPVPAPEPTVVEVVKEDVLFEAAPQRGTRSESGSDAGAPVEEVLKEEAPSAILVPEAAEVPLAETVPAPEPAVVEVVEEEAISEAGVRMTVIVPIEVEPASSPVQGEELKEQEITVVNGAEQAAKIADTVAGATPFLRVIHFKLASDTPVKWDVPALKELSRLAKLNPNLKAVIRGYTDSLGSDEYNKALAGKRVAFVKSYLVSSGIKEEQIRETISLGKKNPVCSTADRECAQANRRVEVLLLLE